MAKMCQKSSFQHIFGIFKCFIGPLVEKFFNILVEEVVSFDLHCHTLKSDKY